MGSDCRPPQNDSEDDTVKKSVEDLELERRRLIEVAERLQRWIDERARQEAAEAEGRRRRRRFWFFYKRNGGGNQ